MRPQSRTPNPPPRAPPPMPPLDPQLQHQFAREVVQRLRAAGFQALWAGGCVRDQLLGRTPKDYDVATSARPEVIRDLFGRRRTVAIGAAFGVITVLGPREAGSVEVATFRRDAPYSDGRHPDSVSFGSPEEDAQRRDFTVNGLFFDPLGGEVLDFVGGQADLQRRLLLAIGVAAQRIEEDKLRMLRAVRFAAGLDFEIEPATRDAVRAMAAQIEIVSPERIAQEMRRMLEDKGRARAVRLLLDMQLAEVILPEITAPDAAAQARLATALAILQRPRAPRFALALAVLLFGQTDAAGAQRLGRRWRLSNKEIGRTCWLVAHHEALSGAAARPWSAVQPVMIDAGMDDLLAVDTVRAELGLAEAADVEWARQMRARPPARSSAAADHRRRPGAAADSRRPVVSPVAGAGPGGAIGRRGAEQGGGPGGGRAVAYGGGAP